MYGSDVEQSFALAINVQRYPVFDPEGSTWSDIVGRARQDLSRLGCCVLPDFINAEAHKMLQVEGQHIAPAAYYDTETINVYGTEIDQSVAEDHPARVTFERGAALVARDRIPENYFIQQLYTNQLFQRFIASCFGLPVAYPMADPLAGLVLNVVQPGMEYSWHFDTNEFAVSLLTQQPEAGGAFEYCPNIRSATNENFGDVSAVLAGRGEHLIRRLSLRPGDLQLFRGRYSLHRVATVRGNTARHTAIFSYSDRPDVIGSMVRTQQLFGRALPEHLLAWAPISTPDNPAN